MEKKKEIRNVETYNIDTFKVGSNEESITLEFGQVVKDRDDTFEAVNVVASVCLKPSALKAYILSLAECGLIYEKEYKKDIGISEMVVEKETEEE